MDISRLIGGLAFAFLCFTCVVISTLGIYYLPMPLSFRLAMAVLLTWGGWGASLFAMIMAWFIDREHEDS